MISLELNKLDIVAHGHNMAGYTTFLYTIAKNMLSLKTILEIGVNNGSSTSSFLLGIADRKKPVHLYSIDKKNVEGQAGLFIGKNSFEKLIHNWTFIHGDSKEVKWDKEIDLLLIDGDHSYEGAKADYDKYVPFVRKGGIILLHDALRISGVNELWHELKVPKVMLNLSNWGMGIIEKC